MDQHSSGASLLEVLFGITLSLSILASLTHPLQRSIEQERRVLEKEELLYKRELLLANIRQGVQGSQAVYAPESIWLHKSNEFRDKNGRPHRILSARRELRPKQQSSIITFLHVEPRLRLKKESDFYCQTSWGVESTWQNTPRKTNYWLAIGIRGTRILNGPLRARKSKRCNSAVSFRGELRAAREVFSLFKIENDFKSHLALPVISYYSLYLDRENRLRYLSHISQENQPILTGITHLEFELQKKASALLLLVEADIELNDNESQRIRQLFAAGSNHPQSLLDLFI